MTTDATSDARAAFEAEAQAEDALSVLLEADIDKVMAGLDRSIEAAPSYRKLFARWERQQWSTEQFDLSVDREQWESDEYFTREQRAAIKWGFSTFFVGEEKVTGELLPFAIAAREDDARVLLATQIADEAKHAMFFHRFHREVLGDDFESLGDNLKRQHRRTNAEFSELFDGFLHDTAERLRHDPSDMRSLVRGVTIYHIVIEGTIGLTAARFMIRSLKERGWFPGFQQGFTAVNRDESRHVGFGVKFLTDAVKEDPSYKRVITDTLEEVVPTAAMIFVPPLIVDAADYVTPFGFSSRDVFEYGLRALRKRLAAMGIEASGIVAAAPA